MIKIISSQRYLDDAIVEAKRAAKDYAVTLSIPVEIGGTEYRVIVDGHHALAAAIEDGVEPDLIDAGRQINSEHTQIVADYGADALLQHLWMDSDYRDALTGAPVEF